MIVYNIRRAKYATQLKPSGVANRWNKDEQFVIYTSGSIALSTLELLAHRNNINVNNDFKLLSIELEIETKDIIEIFSIDLPVNWRSINSYPMLQEIGSDWYTNNKSLILKVPSSLIPLEHNYIINTNHPDFKTKVKIKSTENYLWDERLF
jgi:RES domain-containing protein